MKLPLLQQDARIAIINRGESAMRFLNAVPDFNAEHGTNFKTIALYTRPDQHAKFVQKADIAYALGDALEADPQTLDADGNAVLKSPYLIYDRLKQALVETGASAVWVGWGFVAEHAEFADLCRDMGIVFIGPSGDSMRALGDKIGSKHLAEKAGVPVSPWSKGAVKTVEDAVKWGDKITYPLVIKATSGGGGRGIRRCDSSADVAAAFETCTTEAAKAFGDGTVFMEKMIMDARHLEVQVVADLHGTVWPVGVRDCSVQRRNQKVIEEGPAPILTPEVEDQLKEAAVAVAKESKYHNAGTAEFLYFPAEKKFYFMEMNTRLQVEHPVTEVTTGVDLVKTQLKVAMGQKLEGEIPPTHGHAIEVRLNAEDPYNQFAPSPGKIELFNPPGGPGIRVDSGVETDSEIPSAFDSMVAKIIAYGATRQEAIGRMRRALQDTSLVIENGTSNKSFLLELLNHPVVLENRMTTGWLDQYMKGGLSYSERYREVALIVASIELQTQILSEQRRAFFQTVKRGRPPKLPTVSSVEVELKLEGESYKFEVRVLKPEYYQIHFGEKCFHVRLVRDTAFKARLFYDQQKYSCAITDKQGDLQVEVDGQVYTIERDSGGVVKSNSPAVVLKVHVEAGDKVNQGDPLLTLEAMKMEMLFMSPASGTIRELYVKKNHQVGAGDPLMMIEETAEEVVTTTKKERPDLAFKFDSFPEKKADEASMVMNECSTFLLGYDVHKHSFSSLLRRIPTMVTELAKTDVGRDRLIDFFEDLFDLYFDLGFLFLKQVSVSASDISSPEENFFIYLQLLYSGQEHPAQDFLQYLEKALDHYDMDMDTPPEVQEEALIRMIYSHQNLRQKKHLMLSIYQAYRQCDVFNQSPQLRKGLEYVIERSRDLFRDVHELAMDFYYQMYHKEVQSAVQSSDGLDRLMTAFIGEKDEAKAADYERELLYYPRTMFKYLIEHGQSEAPDALSRSNYLLMRRVNLDVKLHDLKTEVEKGVATAHAHYMLDRNSIMNVSCSASFDKLSDLMEVAGGIVRQSFGHHEVVLDAYLASSKNLKESQYAEILKEAVASFPKLSLLSRMRFVISDSSLIPRCFTFKNTLRGYQEKRLFRGIHEVQAKRLYIERLQGFKTERLPTDENIQLFYCEAEKNHEDQRLIAFSEIREAAPAMEKDGLFTYPALQRGLMMVLKSMRQAQDNYAKKGSFYWNQVIVYVRPVISVSREEFLSFLRRVLSGYEAIQLEKIRIYALLAKPYGDVANVQVEVDFPADQAINMRYTAPTTPLIEPLSEKDFRQALARRRGINYPYEVIGLLTNGYFHKGEFEEWDLLDGVDGDYTLSSVKGRNHGENRFGMVLGVITNYTAAHPEGMKRVLLLSDGNFGLGCLSEPECRYVIAAIEMARERNLPLEWFPISSGAKISMDNGTENLDWTAKVLRHIIDFTQHGGEINLVVDGINVGAQSYWNAEATMMMHTKGCLIMTPRGCMVLTGKGALDYAGSVSAEDNIGIGGLQRIMGPNGQVQFPAKDLLDACDILFRYYAVSYIQPGEKFPRRFEVTDPEDRNVCLEPYSFAQTPDFKTIGDIFNPATNPGKKKPFDMRQVMAAVADKDTKSLERWPIMSHAETAIIYETTLGGYGVTMIGIQSYPIKRHGEVPIDGPDTWSGGTLFPLSSKKLARGLNAASGRRPAVILANLSGFDGSPESLRKLQLEYGAEIGRAVVNFDGPIVFCVLSRYHGGAYVVFSNVLNDKLKAVALEGTYASVIGGAPAAAVVFPKKVRQLTLADKRIQKLQDKMETASVAKRRSLQAQYEELYKEVYTEKQGEVAEEFENIHTVARAKAVGSLNDILKPENLRAYLIDSLREAMEAQQ